VQRNRYLIVAMLEMSALERMSWLRGSSRLHLQSEDWLELQRHEESSIHSLALALLHTCTAAAGHRANARNGVQYMLEFDV